MTTLRWTDEVGECMDVSQHKRGMSDSQDGCDRSLPSRGDDPRQEHGRSPDPCLRTGLTPSFAPPPSTIFRAMHLPTHLGFTATSASGHHLIIIGQCIELLVRACPCAPP